MELRFEEERPIFLQLAEQLEDGILSGAFPEESQIPSTTEISVRFKMNPATALKGINLLVDDGIIYKKRGLGMFVSEGAVEKLSDKRKEQFFERFVCSMIEEARRLGISESDMIGMIRRGCAS
ncbi:MAG: GntR family transcriptional regulator [Clostridiaceae bacterium]|jgi:DNA-binding transcriptional regulator YhcF (GntR family)|nr:GntR family transcriptional regulator [Oscillospiraceae bacterium]NLO61810.1 GntR family transcriptional regulator [Clostridiaceae bacterium]